MLNKLLQPSTWAADFPMVRAGGLFLVIVGFTILAGALLPRKRRLLLMFGFVTGTVMIVLFAAPLAAPAQSPTRSILGSGRRFQDSFRSSDVFRTMKMPPAEQTEPWQNRQGKNENLKRTPSPHLTPLIGVRCGRCDFMVRKTSELRKLS